MKLFILSLYEAEIIEGYLEDFQKEIKVFNSNKGYKYKFRFCVCDMFLKRIDISFKELKNIKKQPRTEYVKLFCEYADAVYPYLLFSNVEKAKVIQKELLKIKISELNIESTKIQNRFLKLIAEMEDFQNKLKACNA